MSEYDGGPGDPTEDQRTPLTDYEAELAAYWRRRKHRQEAETFWRGVLADPVGRREIWAILAQLHCFETHFAAGPAGFPDERATWFDLGQQQFGLRLLHSLMQLDRAGALVMLDEYNPDYAPLGPPPEPPRS